MSLYPDTSPTYYPVGYELIKKKLKEKKKRKKEKKGVYMIKTMLSIETGYSERVPVQAPQTDNEHSRLLSGGT